MIILIYTRDFNQFHYKPASYSITKGSFPGVKWPGREAGHSLPSSAEFKEWVDLYLHSPIRLHGAVLS